jgi:hypothetical protein
MAASGRATEQRDERAPSHSITSSAIARSEGEISMPSILAVGHGRFGGYSAPAGERMDCIQNRQDDVTCQAQENKFWDRSASALHSAVCASRRRSQIPRAKSFSCSVAISTATFLTQMAQNLCHSSPTKTCLHFMHTSGLGLCVGRLRFARSVIRSAPLKISLR